MHSLLQPVLLVSLMWGLGGMITRSTAFILVSWLR